MEENVLSERPLAFLSRGDLPEIARYIEERVRAHDVRLDEGFRSEDRAVDVAFRREVDDGIDVVFLEHGLDGRAVGNVRMLEEIALSTELGVDVGKARGVSRVGQGVKVDDASREAGRLFQKHVDEVAADEAGSAGDEYVGKLSHGNSFKKFFKAFFPIGNGNAEFSLDFGLVENGVCRAFHFRRELVARTGIDRYVPRKKAELPPIVVDRPGEIVPGNVSLSGKMIDAIGGGLSGHGFLNEGANRGTKVISPGRGAALVVHDRNRVALFHETEHGEHEVVSVLSVEPRGADNPG